LSSPVIDCDLVRDGIRDAKLVYFGEYHSESRIVSFLEELVGEWSRCLAEDASSSSSSSSAGGGTTTTTTTTPPCLHLIMEHFSVDMQPMLDRYAGVVEEEEAAVDGDRNFFFPDDDDEAFDVLVRSYKEDYGTEGHDLAPYRDLLTFCRRSTTRRRSGRRGGGGRWPRTTTTTTTSASAW